jgi:capsular polysaccharide biosynthesis protein
MSPGVWIRANRFGRQGLFWVRGRFQRQVWMRRMVNRFGPAVRKLPSDIRPRLLDEAGARKVAGRVVEVGHKERAPATVAAGQKLRREFKPLPRYRLAAPGVAEFRDIWLVGAHATPITKDGRILLSPFRNLRWSFLEEENADVVEFIRQGRFRSDPVVVHEQPTLSLVSRFDPNYYHWMTELLPQVGQIEARRGPSARAEVSVVVRPRASRFVGESLALAGWGDSVLSFPPEDPVLVRNLLVPTYPGNGVACSPRSVQWVRDRLAPARSITPGGPPIFLVRRAGGWRSIVNIDEVTAAADAAGYRALEAETLSLAEQLAIYQDAPALAGQHGAGLVNIIFFPQSAPLLEIRGVYGDAGLQSAAACTHHPFRGMVCETRGDDIVVDPRMLEQELRSLLAAAERVS